jgi:radical SAM superfamily enzyme YgiQ (UPF0313 family)
MIVNDFSVPGGNGKNALLINPPIYDTRYWDRWSQPYGLLRISSLLKKKGFCVELIDCLSPVQDTKVKKKIRSRVNIDDVEMSLYHFGISLGELEKKLVSLNYYPDCVYVTSIMTYWWESTRDVISLLKKVFPKTEVLLGGIYPTLCPEHAEEYTEADIVVVGEISEASNLWTDVSLYPVSPSYAVISASRGCPYDCAHCAQLKINGPGVRHRDPEDVVNEILEKNKVYGIRKFAFYEDNILIDCENHFEKIIDLILEKNLKLHLSAPEGVEVRLLYPRLLKKMKRAGFKSIYLPLELASHDGSLQLDQKNVQFDEFDRAVDYCEQAGYRPGIRQDLNAFILYGVPHQPLNKLIDSILYAVHRVGNVTPMLYTPVPGSRLYQRYEGYFKEKGMGLEDLNGKLFPFWEISDMKPKDYIEIQRFMYAFHTQFRGRAFDLLGDSLIPKMVRKGINNLNGN